MSRALILSEVFKYRTSRNIEEEFLPALLFDLLPNLIFLDLDGYLSLEAEDIELKIKEAIRITFSDELSGEELNKYLEHKHLQEGGCLYQLAFHHSLFAFIEKTGVNYVH